MQVVELPKTQFKNLSEIFTDKDIVPKLQKEFSDNCVGLAQALKTFFNKNGVLAEVMTFKNGNAFTDDGINVYGNIYTHHAVVLMGEWVIDALHTDSIIPTKEYIENLKKNNPKLRIDYTLSTCWYTDEGYPYKPSIEDLENYRYKQ